MRIIMGIDPGSRITGYGIIRSHNRQLHYLASGCIKITAQSIGEKLGQIDMALTQLISQFTPTEVAVEDIFFHRNPRSAIKLGQARGAAIVSAARFSLVVYEYSARQVKQAVVGYGAAAKTQVQQMVRVLLNLSQVPQPDAADALAVALCHAHIEENKIG